MSESFSVLVGWCPPTMHTVLGPAMVGLTRLNARQMCRITGTEIYTRRQGSTSRQTVNMSSCLATLVTRGGSVYLYQLLKTVVGMSGDPLAGTNARGPR